jgi:hypothetical protein
MISVVTFYTPEYTKEATEWRTTCNEYLQSGAVQYPFKSYEKPSKKSWVHNCTMKAEVILNAIFELNSGVVWTDADARFKAYPQLFEQLHDYDFGCYWIPEVWNKPQNIRLKPWSRGNEALAGGTLFFNNTQIAIDLIYAWKKQSEENPTVWEQQSLQKVWEIFDNKGLRTFNFPQSYCKVFDSNWFEEPKPIIIEHTQASRRLKREVNAI